MQCLCPAISKWITWVQPSRSSLASCRGQAVAVRRIRRTSRVDGWCEGSSAVTISCISLHWSALFFDTGHYSRCPYSADIRYLCIIFQISTFFSTPLGPTRVGTSLHQSSCFSLVGFVAPIHLGRWYGILLYYLYYKITQEWRYKLKHVATD